MGATVLELPRVKQHMESRITHWTSQRENRLDGGSDEQQAVQDLKAVDEAIGLAIEHWSRDLIELEKNPQNYIDMCKNRNVKQSIRELDQLSESIRTPRWVRIGKLAKQRGLGFYPSFKKVDDRLSMFITILQEISWNLSMLYKADNLDESQFILVE